jgi:SOS-response transcriptional repressor LexA
MLAPSEQTKHWLGWYLQDGREAKNLSVEQAAIRIGISAEVLLSYETGQVDHDPNLLVKIVEQYDLRLSRMLLRAMRSASHDHERYLALDEVSAPPNSSEIPIKGFVFAGIPQENYDADYREIILPSFIVKYSDTFALLVSGDEWGSESIYDGDVLFVFPETRPRFGRLYVVRIDGIPYVRRIVAERDRPVLKSPDGHSEDYQPSTMEIMGEVVSQIRRIDREM